MALSYLTPGPAITEQDDSMMAITITIPGTTAYELFRTILVAVWWHFSRLFYEYHWWVVQKEWNLLMSGDSADIKQTLQVQIPFSMSTALGIKYCFHDTQRMCGCMVTKGHQQSLHLENTGQHTIHCIYKCESFTVQASLSFRPDLYGSPFSSSVPHRPTFHKLEIYPCIAFNFKNRMPLFLITWQSWVSLTYVWDWEPHLSLLETSMLWQLGSHRYHHN